MINLIDRLVPEHDPAYTRTLEGSDGMSSHLKSALFGQSLTIPITRHRLNRGTWQGIYLGEFRDSGGSRALALMIIG